MTRHRARPEPLRRLLAIRAEIPRAVGQLRRQRALSASYELAAAIEGDSAELRQRHERAAAHASTLARWLAQMRAVEQALAAKVAFAEAERAAS